MAYSKTAWVEGGAPGISAANLNKIENGIYDAAPPGTVKMHSTKFAPTGYLICDGAAYSRTTYADLFEALCVNLGTATITIASPGVVTRVAHGLDNGDPIYFTTTGALPTGLTANTIYYVRNKAADTFQLSSTPTGAIINTSGTQSGVHTLRYCPHGLGNGSTTFNVPSFAGKVVAGWDLAQTEFDVVGEAGGAKTVALAVTEIPGHTHTEASHSHTTDVHSHSEGSHAHGFVHSHTVTGTAASGGSHSHAASAAQGNVVRQGEGTNANITTGGGGFTLGDGTSTDGAHTHSVSGSTDAVGDSTGTGQGAGTGNAGGGSTSSVAGGGTGSTGGGAAHQNLQPYSVLPYIVKT